MAWLQCSLDLPGRAAEQAAELLEGLGAVSVALADAGDEPVLEPGPGETPLWPEVRITALFDPAVEPALVRAALARSVPGSERGFTAGVLEDRDWAREWLKEFGPMRFGRRLWICPAGMAAPDDDAAAVLLDPGLAFGTGTHPTTALCLEWLDGLGLEGGLEGATVVDYGCGSGILALAAARLGAARVIAVDNDPQALIASRENARRNGLAEVVEIREPEGLSQPGADLLVANILAGPLKALTPRFAGLVRPGGRLALSGLLGGQAAEVAAAAEPWFVMEDPIVRDDWVLLEGRRRPGES